LARFISAWIRSYRNRDSYPTSTIWQSPTKKFRLTEDEALINRLGFPGRGSQYVAKKISRFRPVDLILGVNLGKNADTPLHSALDDYQLLIKRFYGLADYLVINVSSPNTEGLRRLQARTELDKLLNGLITVSQEEEKVKGVKTPILIKISPDLSNSEINDILDIVKYDD
jgi:dihydroorotate dehydrogenase